LSGIFWVSAIATGISVIAMAVLLLLAMSKPNSEEGIKRLYLAGFLMPWPKRIFTISGVIAVITGLMLLGAKLV